MFGVFKKCKGVSLVEWVRGDNVDFNIYFIEIDRLCRLKKVLRILKIRRVINRWFIIYIYFFLLNNCWMNINLK